MLEFIKINKFYQNKSRSTFYTALIPIIFLLTAFNSSFPNSNLGLYTELPDYNEFQTPPGSIQNYYDDTNGMLLLTELDQTSISGDALFSGPLDKNYFEKPQGITKSENSRTDGTDSDLQETAVSSNRASGIDINVSNSFTYNSIIDELPSWYSAGEVGKTTTFGFWIENIGTEAAFNVKVNFRIFDYFSNEAENQSKTITQIGIGENISLNFDWIPQYSNYYIVSLKTETAGDIDLINNEQSWKYIIAVRWSEDFESNDLSDWKGDTGENTRWHITDSITNDPDSNAHSSPHALFHGDEGTVDDYGIGENYYLTLPSFDLRRFKSDWPGTYLLYQFYGSSSLEDELILEISPSPEKDFEYSDLLPRLSGDTKHEVSKQFEWQAWHSGNSQFFGIPISIFTGEIVQFRLHWTSDNIPEDNTGFYLDDFLMFGLESPKPQKDIGLDNLKLEHEYNPWDIPVVGDKIDISVDVKNYGRLKLSDINIALTIHDEQSREVQNILSPTKTIPSLDSDGSVTLKWEFYPEISGNFYISIHNLLSGDETDFNDYLNTTTTVAKFYTGFENGVANWTASGTWSLANVPNDPEPGGHTRNTAWYFGDENLTYDTNYESILKSPIIDLQGINPSNPDIKVFTDFKFYGYTANPDILYFEYALDGSDIWKLVNDGGSLGVNYSTLLSGYYGLKWYDLDDIKMVQAGSTDFIGHSVQFRWRFSSDIIDESLPGYFIDDFIVWSIEEDYDRPEVKSVFCTDNQLENQYGDHVLIGAEIGDKNTDIVPGGVTADLTGIGLSGSTQLFDDGTNGDAVAKDGIYTLNITGNPDMLPGMYLLVIQAVDAEAKIGRGFIKLEIVENLPPELIDIKPVEHNVNLNENETVTFSLEASDIGDLIAYTWRLNEIVVLEGPEAKSFEFKTLYDGNFSAGNYRLNVTVFDDAIPSLNSTFEWNITVQDVLPDFVLNAETIEISDKNPEVDQVVYFNFSVFNIGLKPEYNVNVTMFERFETGDGLFDSTYKLHSAQVINYIDYTNPYYTSFSWKAAPGQYTIKFAVDPDNHIAEQNESNNVVIITFDVVSPQTPRPQGKTNDIWIFGNTYFLTVIITVVLVSAGFGAAVGGTEIGRYRFFSLLVPLYSRLKGTKILSHSLREEIYNHIKKYPGDHYRSIMNKLNLKNGTLVHHLSRLEQEDLIKSQKDGLYKRFYPVGMKVPSSDVGMYYPDGTITYNISNRQVSEIQMNILKAINDQPGCTQKDISESINESRRVVNYHVKQLATAKLIKVIRDGRETKCFLMVDLT